MIRHVWSVLCSQSVRDADTQNVSLINVIEQLKGVLKADAPTEGAILLPLPMELISLWERGDWELLEQAPTATVKAAIRIYDPTGEQLARAELTADVSGQHRCRTVLRLNGIPLTVSGRYRLEVAVLDDGETDGRVVAELPIEVIIQREDAAAAA